MNWQSLALTLTLIGGLRTALAQNPVRQTWVLDQSTLSYHMSHPVHEVDGVSHGAKGRGVCQAGACEFLLAASVRSFDSGDTNRDLHMMQVVRGAEFPVVTVRFHIPQDQTSQPAFRADLDVSFAGQTAHYPQVAFVQTMQGSEHRITGLVPATLTAFKIDPPRFLTVPIRNDIPIKVETTWHSE